jgi:hypothetical protein
VFNASISTSACALEHQSMDGEEETSKSIVRLRPLLPTVDQRVRGFYWGSRGLRPWEEVQLYFKIVACHASYLADLFERRASQFAKLRETCESLSAELKSISLKSMDLCHHNRFYGMEWDRFSRSNKHLSYYAWETTFCLRSCIKDLQYFDSFCRVVHPQPGMELIAWDRIQLENFYAENPEHLDFHCSGEDGFRAIAESAVGSLMDAEKYVVMATGLWSFDNFPFASSSWDDW